LSPGLGLGILAANQENLATKKTSIESEMKRFLVVADPYGGTQKALAKAVKLSTQINAKIYVIGFVYDHASNLPLDLPEKELLDLQNMLVKQHRGYVKEKLGGICENLGITVPKFEVIWQKRVAEWIVDQVKRNSYDMVIKGANRSETFLYTSTDWHLLRGCQAPVLLISDKYWHKASNVLAAVDLGTKVKSKQMLNDKIVEHASMMARAFGCGLHVGYVAPFSELMRDLDIVQKSDVLGEGKIKAKAYRNHLADKGIEIASIHVSVGPPEKALVNIAAKNKASLIAIGTVGRKKLIGKVIGNTAEKILHLSKTDVLAVKP
jgi:universal stress protein E